ncbi:MAG: chloride channel protein [Verrucomicrobiota bacterium]
MNNTAEPAATSDFRTDRRMVLLALLAVPAGAAGAVMAKALLWLIAVVINLAFYLRFSADPADPGHSPLGPWMILVPVLGALAVGLMARFGSEKIRGHGIPEALEAILLGRSLIQPRVAILKPLSSAISIGTGGPFGAEGPIIMTGGALGSLFAQLFHLSAAERKTLLVAGAAAGMSAVFCTPVAAVLLAVELLLFEWKPRSLVPVAVASLVAWQLRQPLLGPGPVFPVTPHTAASPDSVLVALAIGAAAGLASAALTALVYACEDAFHRLPIHWMWWPALGALAVGIGGRIEPRVLGVGYDTIHSLMRGELLGPALLGLFVAKSIVWAVALGSGTSGGVLAPLLMIGGALGAWLGHWAPGHNPGLWAMVGMGAMMAGAMGAPLTGTLFVLEVSHDLDALPALMAGCVASMAVVVLVLRRSILTEKLARRGQHISREYSVDLLELVRVAEVMQPPPTIPTGMTVLELSRKIADGDPRLTRHQAVFVVDAHGALAGLITRGDLLRALRAHPDGGVSVEEAGSRNPAVAYPDEPLCDAVNRMLKRDVGRLPVVDRADPRRVVGYLGRSAILAARARLQESEDLRHPGPVLANLKNLATKGLGRLPGSTRP